MNKIERLFDPLANGDIEINKIELQRHKYLKPLVSKVKSKGRTKEDVDKLMYVYMMSDIGSMYDHLVGDEKHDAVKNHLGYDDLWKPTPDLVLAVEAYTEAMELSATGRAYRSSCKALYETGKDLDRIMDMITLLKGSLETRINNVKNNVAFTESERMENIKEARAYIGEVAKTQKEIIDSIKSLPALIKINKDLATSFAEESSLTTEVHGGGAVGNRE